MQRRQPERLRRATMDNVASTPAKIADLAPRLQGVHRLMECRAFDEARALLAAVDKDADKWCDDLQWQITCAPGAPEEFLTNVWAVLVKTTAVELVCCQQGLEAGSDVAAFLARVTAAGDALERLTVDSAFNRDELSLDMALDDELDLTQEETAPEPLEAALTVVVGDGLTTAAYFLPAEAALALKLAVSTAAACVEVRMHCLDDQVAVPWPMVRDVGRAAVKEATRLCEQLAAAPDGTVRLEYGHELLATREQMAMTLSVARVSAMPGSCARMPVHTGVWLCARAVARDGGLHRAGGRRCDDGRRQGAPHGVRARGADRRQAGHDRHPGARQRRAAQGVPDRARVVGAIAPRARTATVEGGAGPPAHGAHGGVRHVH